mgnify:CR=1 FL=1
MNTGLQNEIKQNLEKELKSYKNLPRSAEKKDSLLNISNENLSKLGLYLYEYFDDKISSEEALSKVELKGKVVKRSFFKANIVYTKYIRQMNYIILKKLFRSRILSHLNTQILYMLIFSATKNLRFYLRRLKTLY